MLLFRDQFTKGSKANHLDRMTGTLAALSLAQVIHDIGCPEILLSDNAQAFESDDWNEVIARCGIDQRKRLDIILNQAVA